MKFSEVTSDYAKALYLLAGEQGAVAGTMEGLRKMSDALDASAKFAGFIGCPAFTLEERLGVAERICGFSPLVKRFIELIMKRRSTGSLPGIIAEYRRLFEESEGVERVEISTADELKPKEKESVVSAAGKLLGKKIEPSFRTEKELIAGVKFKYRDRIADASLSSQLRTIKNELARERT